MDAKISKLDWIFLFLCLLLGILAEESFFRSQIGISYFVFVSAFYMVFFWRYRGFPFSHQRFGYLVLICIWLLSAGYFLNDNMVFYALNILVIPGLVVCHLVLVTSPKNLHWNRPVFITYLFSRLAEALKYNASFAGIFGKEIKQGVDESKFLIWKKVAIGIGLSIPVLFVVINLLVSADLKFKQMIDGIPTWFRVMDTESAARGIIILVCTFAFFGVMQALYKKQIKAIKQDINIPLFQFDSVIAVTVLILINIVYILFTLVQFQYFFSGMLQGDLTYAEYARKGFFELMFVTLINLSITIFVTTFAVNGLKRLIQTLLTLLILSSAVMLCSAFIRLNLYEEAYGFTFTRVLAHSFMIFLVVIFTYTLIKIWVEKLSLFHFYFISSLLYYTAISVTDLNQIVVKQNLARYESSGKIDVQYLNSMSYTGVLGLIDLYQKEQDIPELKTILQYRKSEAISAKTSWQSYNLKRVQALSQLENLQIK